MSGHLTALLNEARALLRRYPRVLSVGFGWKETRGRVTRTAALRVYVREKVDGRELRRDEVIPAEVGGAPTDVLPAPTAVPASSPAVALVPGAAVTNLRGVLGGAARSEAGSGLGALGFFAAANGTTERLDVVLVSNRHVLLAHGARRGDPIYQPAYVYREGAYEFRRDSLRPVAAISDEGHEGHYLYGYPGEGPATYFIDCAAARLSDESARRFRPALSPDGPRPALRGVARAHPIDAFAGGGLRLRKLGPATGLTFGRLLDAAAVAVTPDGARRENNLLIRAEPRGGPGRFADEGDSGALVFDRRHRAVGLLWGRSLSDPSVAFACHIHPVLARLGVTPLTYDPSALANRNGSHGEAPC
jgi:hypothetical protein